MRSTKGRRFNYLAVIIMAPRRHSASTAKPIALTIYRQIPWHLLSVLLRLFLGNFTDAIDDIDFEVISLVSWVLLP